MIENTLRRYSALKTHPNSFFDTQRKMNMNFIFRYLVTNYNSLRSDFLLYKRGNIPILILIIII